MFPKRQKHISNEEVESQCCRQQENISLQSWQMLMGFDIKLSNLGHRLMMVKRRKLMAEHE
jgi:hypothetical protein